ncbi:Rrf2 family transcriptional regulator [Bacteroidota bacterium]|nr:Rrf2 family transcriptional regulator [Bacteroidota bacterium]
MLSKKAKYGLQAIIFLAKEEKKKKGPIQISELAEKENIPKKFLEIILLEMRKQGILHSKMGAGGGYSLGKSADKISIGQIVRLLDGPLAQVSCLSKTAYHKCDECKDEKTCEIRKVMKKVHESTARILDRTSLADAVKGKVNI